LIATGACEREADRRKSTLPATAQADRGNHLKTPYPIEPFDAVDLDGTKISLAAWKGQVVVVNVWATWCAPCRRELPALAALQERYRGKVVVLGLLQDNVTDQFAREFAKRAGIRYPVVRSTFDIEGRFPAVLVLPMTFVLDLAGRLVVTYAGEVDPDQLDLEVRRLLGG
jgi:thiol-disulfide isomerase/thioredoxin